jgi:dihydrofolate reductase
MRLCLIYARSENRCIGRDGGLPWKLPDEFRHFKCTTMGCPIVMGRRTFEDHQNVLPGRTNIVLSRDPSFKGIDGLVVRRSLEEVMREYAEHDGDLFVIGGAVVYAQAFPLAQRVYETIVHTHVEGDTFLPPFDFAGWSRTVLEEHPADERHAHAYTALRWDRP